MHCWGRIPQVETYGTRVLALQHGAKRKYTFKYHMSVPPEVQNHATSGPEPQKVLDTLIRWPIPDARIKNMDSHLRPAPSCIPHGQRLRSRAAGRSCQSCGTASTPEWRMGPNGKGTLCNAYDPK